MNSFSLAFLLFGTLFVYLSASVSAGSLTYGEQHPQDRLLGRDIIKKSAPWFTTNTVKVVFPPKNHENLGRITAINIQDMGGRENYSTAELVEGGPGYMTSTIIVKSQKRRPTDMVIEYFGL